MKNTTFEGDKMMKKVICFGLILALLLSCCSCGGEAYEQYVCDAENVASVKIVKLEHFIEGKYDYEYYVSAEIMEAEEFINKLNEIEQSANKGDPQQMENGLVVIKIVYENGDFDLVHQKVQNFNREGETTSANSVFNEEAFEALITEYTTSIWDEKNPEDEKPLDSIVGAYSNTSIFRNIAFIGDSLSSGEFETVDANGSRGYHDMYQYSWGQYIARKNGLTAYNFSKGGMTAKRYIDSFADENDLWNKDKACQAYVIALGVNDLLNQNMTIGTADDITAELTPSSPFISYYAEIVRRYKEISPDAKFFFVTFPNEGTRTDKVKFEGMVNAMYSLAEHFDNSYVIDLYKYGPVYDDEFREMYYLHGHLNPMGYILTANLVDSYIDYIIRKNPNDFKNVGFIGTDIKYK